MPNEMNYSIEEINGQVIEKPLLVTITLEEYRSLIRENAMHIERINDLENRLAELNAPKGCVDNG